MRDQKGAAPVLILIAVIGVVGFLVLTSWAPFRSGLFSSLFPKDSSYAAGIINSSLGTGINLQLTGLDSTIRANWTPSTDTNIAWQVFSVWDGATLIGTKVLSKTAGVADGNGLMADHQYTIKVQGMNASGELSNPLQANASTDMQSPIKDAAFFDNFNDAPDGDLNPDLYDVRIDQRGETELEESKMTMASERHWHTQLIGGNSQSGIIVRPRVPIDFTNRTATIEFEVDSPPIQASHGKWWELNIVKDLPANAYNMGIQDGSGWPDKLEFAMFGQDDNSPTGTNRPVIYFTDANENVTKFVGNESVYTPPNVRVPVVIKFSQNSAEMWINGKLGVKATGVNLTYTKGHVLIVHKEYFADKIDYCPGGLCRPPVINQLTHWENFQFDGPAGSYVPVTKTYIQPNCKGRIFMSDPSGNKDCPNLGQGSNINVPLQIPDDVTKLRSARLFFQGAPPSNLAIKVNTTTLSGLKSDAAGGKGQFVMNYIDVPVSALKAGSNTVSLTVPGGGNFSWQCCYVGGVQIEAIYNIAKLPANPPLTPMPMISATSNSFYVQQGAGNLQTFTTYLYALGSDQDIPYMVSVPVENGGDWLNVTTPLTGTVKSPAVGGKIMPITFTVDTTKLQAPSNLAVIQVKGGHHPTPYSIGVLIGPGNVGLQTTFPMNYSTFNKAAIPDYHLTTSPLPSQTPTPAPSITPSPSPAKPGDIDGNNKVDIFDYNILLTNFGKTGSGIQGDFDNNGKVDIFDFNTLLTGFGK